MLASSSSAVFACFLEVKEVERSPYTRIGDFFVVSPGLGFEFGGSLEPFRDGGLRNGSKPPSSPICSVSVPAFSSPPESSSSSKIGFRLPGGGLVPKGCFLV